MYLLIRLENYMERNEISVCNLLFVQLSISGKCERESKTSTKKKSSSLSCGQCVISRSRHKWLSVFFRIKQQKQKNITDSLWDLSCFQSYRLPYVFVDIITFTFCLSSTVNSTSKQNKRKNEEKRLEFLTLLCFYVLFLSFSRHKKYIYNIFQLLFLVVVALLLLLLLFL